MGFNYLQTDDRDDYFSQFEKKGGPKIDPTFKITRDGVIVHESILGRLAAQWAKDTFGVEKKYVKHGRWKDLVTERGCIVENLKTGFIGPDPTTKKIPEMCSCGRTMIIRTNSKDNTRFYGCSSFPRCRNTKPFNS